MSVAERLTHQDGRWPRQGTALLFRAVNERIRELAGESPDDYDFMCECEDATCMRVVRLTIEAYQAVRAIPRAFVVLQGHERPDDEVISRNDGLVVIRPANGRGD